MGARIGYATNGKTQVPMSIKIKYQIKPLNYFKYVST